MKKHPINLAGIFNGMLAFFIAERPCYGPEHLCRFTDQSDTEARRRDWRAMVGLLLMVLLLPAMAEQKISAEYDACINGPELKGHWDHTQCMADEVERQKALLNLDYKALLRDTDPMDVQGLERAQRAWIRFRDLDCKAQAEAVANRGGNGAWDAEVNCMVRHLLLRREQIQTYWNM